MSLTLAAPPRWTLRSLAPELVEALAQRHALARSTAALLLARGLSSDAAIKAHLEPRLSALHDPALLPGMQAATARIRLAIERRETILVHGDYDVDGVTGTTLLMRLFALVGAKARWHIPNRFTDGYSFGPHSVIKARECGATLVISVDNGTSANTTIAELNLLGIDTIVTDHHEPPSGALPAALAIVNPKLVDSRYPFRELCGGAVAFKLAWGLCQELSGAAKVRADLREFLVEATAYVAIATVCDVVPLVDENRVLARYGLKSLAATTNPGLVALLRVAKLTGLALDSEDVGFRVGPRINASGRLGSAEKAVELLLATDADKAANLAQELDDLNERRKEIESELLQQALAQAEPFADRERHPVLVLAGEGWHQGVVGIVAARMAQRYARPALVISLDGALGRGSARSVPGFSVLEAMRGGEGLFLRFGGHDQAAGCEVRASDIDAVRTALCERARAMLGEQGFLAREVTIDLELPFAHMNGDLMREIDRLKPFGEQNEKPVFLTRGLRLAQETYICGGDRTHLMLRLRAGAHVLKAMAFGMASRAGELSMGADIDAVYTPKWNTFRGETNLELELIDFRAG